MQTISATDLFSPVAEQIRRTSTPTPRGEAIAVTIEQLALLARPDLRYSPALMRQAYLTLAAHIEGEVPQVAARRGTCLEIADAIGAVHNLGARPGPEARAADLEAVLSWWGVALLAPGEHPRWVSIRETAGREMSELERAIARDRTKAPTRARLLEIVRAEMALARQAGQKHAHIDLGVPREMGRDGGQARQDAMAMLRAEGYRVELDGRSGQLMVEVDNALRPVASRRERPAVDPAVAAELALEALDAMARELRQEPANITRRQALEVNLHTALDRLHIETTGAIVDVINAALGLSMSEAAVVADVLISVKPALARARGVPTF